MGQLLGVQHAAPVLPLLCSCVFVLVKHDKSVLLDFQAQFCLILPDAVLNMSTLLLPLLLLLLLLMLPRLRPMLCLLLHAFSRSFIAAPAAAAAAARVLCLEL
jgi:hypothetical protein